MKAKQYVSVICEYNPFHFGHKFQLEQLKSRFDGVVCIMSGDIVQRGSVAIADKYLRAKAALCCGADLVLELPIPFCCASAKDFAASGVHIADCIGSDFLGFGAEDGEDVLAPILSLVSTDEFSARIKEYINIKGNVSYPKALFELVKDELGEEVANAVKKPNNILALEYMSALKDKKTKPFAVKRNSEFLSSSLIREKENGEEILKLLPDESKSIFSEALNTSFPRDSKKLDSFFIGLLRSTESNASKNDFYAVPDDLFKKITQNAVKHDSVDKLVDACCDKTYTSARIRRAINSIVFNITKEKATDLPSYTSVLAVNEKGREILKRAKGIGKIDIVTKPVKALEFGGKTKEQFLFAKGVESIISMTDPQPLPADVGKSPFVI